MIDILAYVVVILGVITIDLLLVGLVWLETSDDTPFWKTFVTFHLVIGVLILFVVSCLHVTQ